MLIYAALEDAVIARIKAASDAGALGYKIPEIGSYGGQFDDETFFTQFRRFPAAWVTVAGSRPKPISARKSLCTLTLAVMVGTRNVRGERATRHGGVNEVGSYQMLDDVRNLLAGQSFNLGIAPLRIGADRTLFNTRLGKEARSVLAAEFATDYTYTVADEPAGDLLQVGLNYYLKPGDNQVDAVDLVPPVP